MDRPKKHSPYIGLKRMLAFHGITYKDVAQAIRTTEATVMCKINGDSDFFVSEMRIICQTFNIDPEIFFGVEVA